LPIDDLPEPAHRVLVRTDLRKAGRSGRQHLSERARVPVGILCLRTKHGAGGAPAADIGWRDFFADPRLQRLISIALKNNRDLRIATLHVEDLRAKYQIQRSTLFPTVDALANSTTLHRPGALQYAGEPSTIYSLGVGVTSYELDFFGRVRSLKDQALQQYFSTEAARTSAQISLVAEVANAYLTWEANQELVALAQETLKTQQAGYDIMTSRVATRSGACANPG
jgi:multidrug efflux system outer membrane protein